MLVYVVAVITYALILGFATRAVIINKGYDENWFWWGFWFGIIALIVACAKPQNVSYPEQSRESGDSYHAYTSSFYNQNSISKKEPIPAGGWECTCGRVHAAYVTSCTCGKSKSEVKAEHNKKQETERKAVEKKKAAEEKNAIEEKKQNMGEMDKAAAIKAYKELLDTGAISSEEFEAKKKQLLGL